VEPGSARHTNTIFATITGKLIPLLLKYLKILCTSHTHKNISPCPPYIQIILDDTRKALFYKYDISIQRHEDTFSFSFSLLPLLVLSFAPACAGFIVHCHYDNPLPAGVNCDDEVAEAFDLVLPVYNDEL
jgi:hypothetical protein